MLEMKKPRILWVSDSARISSGFGRIVREVGTRLLKTGKYEIAQHGWFDHLAVQDVPFPVFPTLSLQDGMPHPEDRYGKLSFDRVASRYAPDLVIGVGDPPFLSSVYRSTGRQGFRTIFYVPVDGFPLPEDWAPVLECPDRLILFGEWPKKLLEAELGVRAHTTIPHGVDTRVFRPPTLEEVAAAKRRLSPGFEGFLFGFVGRNSERKRIDLVIQAVSLLRHGAYGYCHTCHRHVPDLLDSLGNRFPSTRCRLCGNGGFGRAVPRDVKLLLHTPLLENPASSVQRMAKAFRMEGCIFCDPNYQVAQGIPDEQLREYYWAIDCYLSFAMEGWGFPILEAMSSGTSVVTGNYSMPPEYCREGAFLVEPETWISEQRTGLLRPVPDLGQFLSCALLLMDLGEARRDLSRGGRAKAETLDWDLVSKRWEEEIDRVLVEAKPVLASV